MKVVAAVTVAAVLCVVGDVLGEDTVLAPSEIEEESGAEDSRREEKIFALYVSTSATVLATTTVSALSTCLSVDATGDACVGRKKRNIHGLLEWVWG